MKRQFILGLALLVFAALDGQRAVLCAQGTAFNYQGSLSDGGNPASGSYDLRFTVYDATNVSGTMIAGPVTNLATAVSNGLFNVSLDFGEGVFSGSFRCLQLEVRTNGAGVFTPLWPRQSVQPVPYSMMANSASNLLGTLPATQLAGTVPLAQLPGAVVTNGGNFSGTFSGNGAGLTNLNAAQLTGIIPAASLPGNVVTNTVSLSLDFGSSTNTYYVTNCPDVSYDGPYTFFSSTNGGAYLTNSVGRCLRTFTADLGQSQLQPSLSNDNEAYDNATGEFEGSPYILPSGPGSWEDASGNPCPSMVCYGLAPSLPNQTQLTVSTLVATNTAFQMVSVTTSEGLSTFGPTANAANGIGAISPMQGGPVECVYAIQAALSGSPITAHDIFQEWVEDKNGNKWIQYAYKPSAAYLASHPGMQWAFTEQQTSLGQTLLGYLQPLWPDQYLNIGPAWLNIFGQNSCSNDAAIWLQSGPLSSNSAPGCIQYSTNQLWLTVTNTDGASNSLPLIVSGQSQPVVLTNAASSFNARCLVISNTTSIYPHISGTNVFWSTTP